MSGIHTSDLAISSFIADPYVCMVSAVFMGKGNNSTESFANSKKPDKYSFKI